MAGDDVNNEPRSGFRRAWLAACRGVFGWFGVRDATAASVFGAALLIRLVVTAVGEIADARGLRYTDIDYVVFSEAAREVVAGNSPYDRATYRYSPIL